MGNDGRRIGRDGTETLAAYRSGARTEATGACALVLLAWSCAASVGCARDFRPSDPSALVDGPLTGRAPSDFRPELACSEWRRAAHYDREASAHTSYPELRPTTSCYVPVFDEPGRPVRVGEVPAGCGYPASLEATRAHLIARASLYEAVAAGTARTWPLELACGLSRETRSATARANARTLRSLAEDPRALASARAFPYSAVSTFGFGAPEHDTSVLVGIVPGSACVALSARDKEKLGVNVLRAQRAFAAFAARVAPVVTVSGGAVHSELVEAFALEHILRCEHGVPEDRILLDPCADHTHTNLRNTGALVNGLGGRTAYVVTDPFLQSTYLGDFTFFDFLGGSMDQRSLRDFGHLLGAWRRASVGTPGGFWFTPYRFWADPGEVGRLACTDDVPLQSRVAD